MQKIIRSPKDFGQLIRHARKQAGMTQSQLAVRSGVWQETISKIENGHAGSKLETIFEILAALDLEITGQERSKGSTDDFEDMF